MRGIRFGWPIHFHWFNEVEMQLLLVAASSRRVAQLTTYYSVTYQGAQLKNDLLHYLDITPSRLQAGKRFVPPFPESQRLRMGGAVCHSLPDNA